MRPGKRKRLNPFIEHDFVAERVEKIKTSIRAKVEHPSRVIKLQFGFTTVRYLGLEKNTAEIVTLYALSNLRMVCRENRESRCVRLQPHLEGLRTGSDVGEIG